MAFANRSQHLDDAGRRDLVSRFEIAVDVAALDAASSASAIFGDLQRVGNR
jgi:hypothetical protein